jgi:hypothetical protein
VKVQNLGHFSSDLAPKDYEQQILLGANTTATNHFIQRIRKMVEIVAQDVLSHAKQELEYPVNKRKVTNGTHSGLH